MMPEMTEEQLKEMASQLSCPDGAKGLETAEMMHRSNFGMTMATIAALELTGGQNVLELGPAACGHLEEILLRAEAIRYTGLEISATMQEQASRTHVRYSDAGQAEFMLYDGRSIPFGDQVFDRAMTVNTLYFWEEPEELLQEIYRVLKPGGIFVLTYATKAFMKDLPFVKYRFRLYNNEDVQALAAVTGFSLSVLDKRERVQVSEDHSVERSFSVAVLRKPS